MLMKNWKDSVRNTFSPNNFTALGKMTGKNLIKYISKRIG